MPMIELKTAIKIPSELAEKLTKTTVEVVKCPINAVSLFLRDDYKPIFGAGSVQGQAVTAEVKMTSGRPKDLKVTLLKRLTDDIQKATMVPKERINVILDDSYDLDEWAVGGDTWEEIVARG